MDISAVLETATPEQIMEELDRMYISSTTHILGEEHIEHIVNLIATSEHELQNLLENGSTLYQKYLLYWQDELAIQQQFSKNLQIVHTELINSINEDAQFKLNALANLATSNRSRLNQALQMVKEEEHIWIENQILNQKRLIFKYKSWIKNT